MKFELTKEFLDSIRSHCSNRDEGELQNHLKDLHAADISEIIQSIDLQDARFILSALEENLAADSMMELDDAYREQLLELFSPEEIADTVSILDTDDAADLLGDLSDREKTEVISHIDDKEHITEVTDLLKYGENTAGGLMQTEFVRAEVNWPVTRCIVEMRKQVEHVEKVYSIYVVDDRMQLLGILSLKRLLFATPGTLIGDIYQAKDVKFVRINDTSATVAEVMQKYNLVSLPVVDLMDKLVGRITIDDAVDVIREEADKDFQMASGITEFVEPSTSILKSTRSRLPWILIGLAGGVFSSMIIRGYETEIEINPALAFFIPLIVATAGNIGVQSSAIVVQGLASGDFQFQGILKQISKESMIGLLVGLICALAIFSFNMVTGGDLNLGLTLGVSLFSVVIVAAILGAWIPLVLNRIKIDPALATGPFITTANDILGLTIYFFVAYLFYF